MSCLGANCVKCSHIYIIFLGILRQSSVLTFPSHSFWEDYEIGSSPSPAAHAQTASTQATEYRWTDNTEFGSFRHWKMNLPRELDTGTWQPENFEAAGKLRVVDVLLNKITVFWIRLRATMRYLISSGCDTVWKGKRLKKLTTITQWIWRKFRHNMIFITPPICLNTQILRIRQQLQLQKIKKSRSRNINKLGHTDAKSANLFHNFHLMTRLNCGRHIRNVK